MKLFTSLLLLAALACLNPDPAFSQLKVYSFEEIDSLQKTENRKTVVFIHTDWCRFCHTMQNTCFGNDSIIELLNKAFYFVSLNGEEARNISFNGHIFKHKPTGQNTGTHELAEQLGTIGGKLSYPSLCILSSGYEIVFQYNGLISSADLFNILTKALNSP
jgi:thioredoxin-related protein